MYSTLPAATVVGVDVGHAHQARSAEERVHRALGVGRDDDDAPAGRDVVGHRAGTERHADREQIVAEHPAQLVVAHLADVGGAAPEAGDATHRVGGRAAAHLDRRTERPVQLDGAFGLDQRHRSLHEVVLPEELVAGVGDHVDERVADADDVVGRCVGRRRGCRSTDVSMDASIGAPAASFGSSVGRTNGHVNGCVRLRAGCSYAGAERP